MRERRAGNSPARAGHYDESTDITRPRTATDA